MTTPVRNGNRPRKEAFFVQVKNADEKPIFFDATDHLGKPMPYSEPLATAALRVLDDAVVFSVLRLTKKARTRIVPGDGSAPEPLRLPHSPLSRLERRLATVRDRLTPEVVIVEIEDEEHVLTLTRDENKVATLATPVDAEEGSLTLPKSALRVSAYMLSPRGKAVAVGFIGHIGRPETPETVVRAASLALSYLSNLQVFKLVAGIDIVNVPAPAARPVVHRVVRKPSDEVTVKVPVRLWSTASGAPAQVAAGFVDVKVDLDTANPVSGRLLFHFTPDAALAEAFEAYRGQMDRAVTHEMTKYLGADEMEGLVYSIALGELSEGDLERLRNAAATVTGLDLAERDFAPFVPQV